MSATLHSVLVRSMGKWFPAKAFPTADDANSFCERHRDWVVIAVQPNGVIFVAHRYPLAEVASNWLESLDKLA